jgi:hypothetical protein
MMSGLLSGALGRETLDRYGGGVVYVSIVVKPVVSAKGCKGHLVPIYKGPS